MEIKKNLAELIDQARILCHKESTEEIAEYLEKASVIPFPVKIGETVYFLSVKSAFGSLLTSGCVIARQVDEVAYDGKIKIISYRPNKNDTVGNLYEYLGEKVFVTKEQANAALAKLKKYKQQDETGV